MQPVSVDLLETQVREQKVFICFFYQMSGKKDTINVKSYMTYETNVYRETSAHELKLDANEMFLLLHYFCQ